MHNFNKQKLLTTRRQLRKNQTIAEYKLWQLIRNRKLLGYKFFRQYSINNFILDFYCPELKLGLEIDGGQHNETSIIQKDITRTKNIEKYKINIIRFWNNDVLNNIEGVYERLYTVAHNSSQPPLNLRGGVKP